LKVKQSVSGLRVVHDTSSKTITLTVITIDLENTEITGYVCSFSVSYCHGY